MKNLFSFYKSILNSAMCLIKVSKKKIGKQLKKVKAILVIKQDQLYVVF